MDELDRQENRSRLDPPRGSQAQSPLSSVNCHHEENMAGILRRDTTSFTRIFLLGNQVIQFMTLMLQDIFRSMTTAIGERAPSSPCRMRGTAR
ncbi:hypothetical protein [Rhizorhabdus wittichii]|uniref:hypothetical protein n=1 Tax=Rhizorhabdus wittichii TaxID=160791 RepID=UPI00178C506C|nr:hypothetical protein [Rhizorhabdus wittichii]